MAEAKTLKSNTEYIGEAFANIKLRDGKVYSSVFENCTFENCSFENTAWNKSLFKECSFKGCSMINIGLEDVRFHDVRITQSKLAALNFSKMGKVNLLLGFSIKNCKLLGCAFAMMDLKKCSLEDNEMDGCSFDQVNMRGLNFGTTSFGGSRFTRCDLTEADFSGSSEFQIDPTDNKLEKACFSMQSGLELLKAFNIRLV